ncbi:MAG: stage III sporulation protein AF [Tepidibacillus sp.]|uniref:stage III sporulation protein AF n=1 Tax=Tepidibacillus sp. HK-1 TaxID=1883407 RepID=UPI000853D752|nr:stage III sporulation protein AF [Tepidibacillus sp. HK-1]GBF11030.1 stage III sporulation protein AF [Tepidibacillus sp. HK-1]
MIEWISSWLQNIILIVLLATFVDLLLPNSDLQKYSKMVLGLLIMLTILSPLLDLFSNQFSVTTLFQQLDQKAYSKEDSVITMEGFNQSNQIPDTYQKNLVDNVEKIMKEYLKEQLEKRFNITVFDVNLEASIVNEVWTIQQVRLSIVEGQGKSEQNNKSNQNDAPNEIENVKAVSIEIEPSKNLTQSGLLESEKSIHSIENKQVNEIIAFIQKEWGLQKEQILINFNSD